MYVSTCSGFNRSCVKHNLHFLLSQQLKTSSLKNTGGSVSFSVACTGSGPGTGSPESGLGVGHGSFEGLVLFEGSMPLEGSGQYGG